MLTLPFCGILSSDLKVKSTFLVSAIIYHNVGSFSNDNSDSSKNVAMKKSGFFQS